MSIESIIRKRPLALGDPEAERVIDLAVDTMNKRNSIYFALYLCIAYGEIRGVRMERARRKRVLL